MPDQNLTTPNNPEPTTPTGGGGDNRVSFTPEQQTAIDRIAAERGKRGGEAAINALLEGLGVKSVDELKASFAEANKLRAAQKSELEKSQDEIARLKQADAEHTKQLAEAKDKANQMQLRVLFGETARKQNLAFATAQAEQDAFALFAASVTMDNEGKVDKLDEAVKEFAKTKPYFFGAAGSPAQGNINATNRGSGGGVDVQTIIEKKRAQYRGAQL